MGQDCAAVGGAVRGVASRMVAAANRLLRAERACEARRMGSRLRRG